MQPPFESGSPAPDIEFVERAGESDKNNRNKALRRAREIPPEQRKTDGKVVNLAFYRIKRNLKKEGFDLITDENGKVTLVMRIPR